MKEKDESMSEMKAKMAAIEAYLMSSGDEPKLEKSASKSARKSAEKGRISYLKRSQRGRKLVTLRTAHRKV